MKALYNVGDIIRDNNSDIKIISHVRDVFKNRCSYKYICLKCGQVGCTSTRTLNKKNNICLVCSNRKIIHGINDIATTDPWMIPYFKNKDDTKIYSSGASARINAICPDCGRDLGIKKILNIKYHKIGCVCGDGNSYPEKYFSNILQQLGLDYIKEYSPVWIKPKRFDFYIKSLNIIVEMDGGIGHGYYDAYNKSARKLKDIDIIKDRTAEQHGIRVYRIDARISTTDYLQQSIANTIGFIDGILNVDYKKADEFAQKNIVKMVSDFYNQTPNCSYQDICDQFHLSMSAVHTYTKKCKELGWIKQEIINKNKQINCYNVNIGRMKRVECVRDNKTLIFESIHKASRETGVRIGNISRCCMGKSKSAGGYIWKYA